MRRDAGSTVSTYTKTLKNSHVNACGRTVMNGAIAAITTSESSALTRDPAPRRQASAYMTASAPMVTASKSTRLPQ